MVFLDGMGGCGEWHIADTQWLNMCGNIIFERRCHFSKIRAGASHVLQTDFAILGGASRAPYFSGVIKPSSARAPLLFPNTLLIISLSKTDSPAKYVAPRLPLLLQKVQNQKATLSMSSCPALIYQN
jgi:hypothetical protein